MRKEVLIAVILGLILGSILVYGIYRASKVTPPQESQTQNQVSPSPKTEVQSILTLNMPQDGDIFEIETATISGQTNPENALIIVTENDQLLPKINPTGNFAQTIELIRGGNLIQVSAITPTGQRQDIFLNLVYTTQ